METTAPWEAIRPLALAWAAVMVPWEPELVRRASASAMALWVVVLVLVLWALALVSAPTPSTLRNSRVLESTSRASRWLPRKSRTRP